MHRKSHKPIPFLTNRERERHFAINKEYNNIKGKLLNYSLKVGIFFKHTFHTKLLIYMLLKMDIHLKT